MSETLSQDTDGGYSLAQSYPGTPATPSSTVQDVPGSNLPPFSTFAADMDGAAGFGSDRLFGDTRLLDISSWDYYGETRLLDRSDNGLSVMASQPQYRPWESKPIDANSQDSLRHQSFATTAPISTFADAFAAQNGMPKLPSFQSQFQTFSEVASVTSSEATLTTLTNLTPVSPSSSSPGGGHLTTLNTNFHTLSTVNPRNYPLVPAPIQAREIPSIQQQFLDERHIQLYTHPTTSLTTLNNTIPASIFPAQNGAIIQNNQLIATPTVVTVLKSEPITSIHDPNVKIQNVTLHPTQFQNPMAAVLDGSVLYNGLDKKINGIHVGLDSPTRNDFRKKERRKIRASSLESSAESDGASSNMDLGSENSGQVASVSSTAGFKSQHPLSGNGMEMDEISGGNADKQVKKKRKRCGECIGCQRKDNCGDCAPCRNDKSHQICKQRRCEKLTEKKLYGEESFIRGESRRGRGKSRNSGTFRGRKPSGAVSLPNNTATPEPQAPSRPSPQPVHMIKQEPQQPMAPMPFYAADPNRFTTPTWQTDPTQGWTQGQFIQQIPTATAVQPALEGYSQQYPNGIYQATYQQSPGFETNTFYTTGPVQVLTSARPPSAPNQAQQQQQRNGSYSHSPSPAAQAQAQSQQGGQRTSLSAGQYQQQEYSTQGGNGSYAAPATTPNSSIDSSQISRPSSVNSTANMPVSNQSFQTQSQQNGTYTAISAANFSPSSTSAPNYATSNNTGASSGNAMPGYPAESSHPQLASHNYNNGYPGASDIGGQTPIWQQQEPQHNHQQMDQHDGSKMQYVQECNNGQENASPATEMQFSQSDRVNLNSRLKTMILNKQQQQQQMEKTEEKLEQNSTGHFLSYSHHRCPPNLIGNGGGVHYKLPLNEPNRLRYVTNQNMPPPHPHHSPTQRKTANTFSPPTSISRNASNLSPNTSSVPRNTFSPNTSIDYNSPSPRKLERMSPDDAFGINYRKTVIKQELPSPTGCQKQPQQLLTPKKVPDSYLDKKPNIGFDKKEFNQKLNVGFQIPECNCFPPSVEPVPEPGGYYTHLGCADSLPNLRKDFETRSGIGGKAIRIEKICYTSKEGKSPQGCPIAKWIIRRSTYEEKLLIIVKHRRGHVCSSAFIVVCIVAWDGLARDNADSIYGLLSNKLNKFGLPTNRRCATNDSRTCACQGLDPDKCGASFSFGCSWSMYYNGCKFARSKTVRKFRLSVESEEQEVEDRLETLVTDLSPMYQTLVPKAFKNQCEFENQASDCRLGLKPGRPFSGVTACVDFCAHAHKDMHNMNDGLTMVVSLTKHRDLSKPEEEQLHVLPLYRVDGTDEFGSKDEQEEKIRNGSIEVLNRYQCEVRVRNTPGTPCRRRKKKGDEDARTPKKSPLATSPSTPPQSHTPTKQLQINQISSTVLDRSPTPRKHYQDQLQLFSHQNSDTALNLASYPGFSRNPTAPLPSYNTIKNPPSPCYNFALKPEPPGFYGYNPLHPGYFPYQQKTYPDPFNVVVQNPFEDYWCGSPNYCPEYPGFEYDSFAQNSQGMSWSFDSPRQLIAPQTPPAPKTETVGRVAEVIDNSESFRDSEVGGVAIALGHGSVLFECAKHELHATTALKNPDRFAPTRISLVFYQHRNMNRPKHGWEEFEEKMRLRKLDSETRANIDKSIEFDDTIPIRIKTCGDVMNKADTMTTASITTVFPMYPCTVTGPYQQGFRDTSST